jgi:mannose-6-phosphate isomerase-like protein (cupin superfamily)
MATVYKSEDATLLGLPGRKSFEIVSGAKGSHSVTLRRVEIPVPWSDGSSRGLHSHRDCEECIVVVSGEGTTQTENADYALKPGDTILIPAGEGHVTRNTGSQPLVLLCFFPLADITAGLHEMPIPSAPSRKS